MEKYISRTIFKCNMWYMVPFLDILFILLLVYDFFINLLKKV